MLTQKEQKIACQALYHGAYWNSPKGPSPELAIYLSRGHLLNTDGNPQKPGLAVKILDDMRQWVGLESVAGYCDLMREEGPQFFERATY